MPQSLANLLVHLVFSTKGRPAILQNPALAWRNASLPGGNLQEPGMSCRDRGRRR